MLGRSGLIRLSTGFHKYGDVFHFTWLSLCVAPSGLDFRWRRFPGLPPWALLHRRFAAPDLKPRKGATGQPRAEAAKRPGALG